MWYKRVPKDWLENLAFRKFVLQKAEADRRLRAALREACKQDVVLWINTFVWQYNPNSIGKGSPELGPFLTWEFQDKLFHKILDCVRSRRNLVIEKSREMGASWGCVLAFLWSFLFEDHKKYIMVSRNEDAVDKPDDPDSLFWKIDFILEHLPTWMTVGVKRQKLSLYSLRTKSSITGQSTTGKIGVGGRATAMFLDEFALVREAREIWQRTSNTSNCRIVNSTHDGPGTQFYDLCQPDMADYIDKFQMHWTQHPDKWRGAYKYDPVKKRAVVLNKADPPPAGYKFDTSGKPTGGPHPGVRSPWYDQKCGEMSDARAVAIDLDIDPQGSVSQYFDAVRIHALMRGAVDPYWEGIVEVDYDTGKPLRLTAQARGPLKLWLQLVDNRPRPGVYCIGADVSQGVGTTPSCLTVIDARMREVVGELVTYDVRPEKLACLTAALGWLFRSPDGMGAQVAWEANGPGGHFARTLMNEFRYDNVFRRKSVQELNRGKVSELPGWVPTGPNKHNLLSSYRSALEGGELVNRSAPSLEECLSFKYSKQGHPVHAKEETDDPTATRVNHGDRVISAALAWMTAREFRPSQQEEERKIPVGSLEWRRLVHYTAARARQDFI